MKWHRLVRNSVAVWSTPIMILAFLYAEVLRDISQEGYKIAIETNVTEIFAFIIPFTALAAAWEGFKLKESRVLTYPHMRSWWRIIMPHIIISAAPAMLLFFGITIWRTHGCLKTVWGSLFVILAWTFFGFALGCLGKAVAMLPLSFMISSFWFIFVPAGIIEPLFLTRMTGILSDCCFLGQSINEKVVIASLLFALGLLAVSLLIIGRAAGAVNKIGMVAIVLVVISAMSASISFAASANRMTVALPDTTNCQGRDPQICLWEEHENYRAEITRVGLAAIDSWRSQGIVIPEKFSEGASSWDGHSTPFGVTKNVDSKDAIIRTFALAMVGVSGDNCVGRTTVNTSGVYLYLLKTAGGKDGDMEAIPEFLAEADRIAQIPVQERIAIINEVALAGRECRL